MATVETNTSEIDEAQVSFDFADMLDEEKRAVDAWLIASLELRPGDEILETACGTAGTGMAVAAKLGPAGRVICSDHSPAMLARARAVARTRGVANVDFRLLDAERTDLPDASVDGVVCRLGFQVMHDVPGALSEAHRVLRPGGRLSLAVWAERGRNPWQAIPEDVLDVPRPPTSADDDVRPGPFALADESLLRRLLMHAGFVGVCIGRVRADQRYASADEFWTLCMRKARRPREAFDRLGAAQREAAKTEILARLAEHRLPGEEEFVIPAELLVAAGVHRA